jgi:aspartate racemase
MAAMARRLAQAGADLLVIACNTAHAFMKDVTDATSVPILDIITLTTEQIANTGKVRRVGLLAADGCIAANLYQDRLATAGLEAVLLERDAQARFMTLLYDIKADATKRDLCGRMNELANELKQSGAEVVVAACTEVPLVLDPTRCNVPLINSIDVLVSATISAAMAK